MEKSEHTATARGSNIGISTKFTVEVAKFIKGKNVEKAKTLLEEVIQKKTAVPFTRFTFDLGHKRGSVGPGRYPVKAAEEILALLRSAEMNAGNKGLDMNNLYVASAIASKGNTQMRPGRHRGRHAKRTHFVITLAEKEIKKTDKKEQKKNVVKKETKTK